MITYQDLIEDGDRVLKVWMHDIEATDEPKIKRQILEADEVSETMIVQLMCPVFEELVDIEVKTKDYL